MAETMVDHTDLSVQQYMVQKMGLTAFPAAATVLGFRDNDGILGGWLFERYTGEGGSIFAHWAGRHPKWLKRYMLQMAAIYIFDQLRCERCYGEVRAKALTVRYINQKLGFKEKAVLNGYYPGDDMILLEMTRQDCVWLPAAFKESYDGR